MLKLSILIPSIPEHATKLKALLGQLKKQRVEGIEILQFETESSKNGGQSIGWKRNRLAEKAAGEYLTFLDADDVISEDYIEKVMRGIESGCDSVCYDVLYRKDSTGFEKRVKYSKDFKRDAETKDYFERLPNHLMVVKSKMVKRTMWKDMTYGEDAEYSKRLKPLLKTEFQIGDILYYYIDTK